MATDDVNARERVRLRLRQLLDEQGITGREFGKRLGHKDQWVTNLLKGRHALSLDELDAAAQVVKVPASALVADEDEEAWSLTHQEQRIIKVVRHLPPPVRHHVAQLLDYLQGVTPEETEVLRLLRTLDAGDQVKIEHWLHAMVIAKAKGIGQDTAPPRDPALRAPETLRPTPLLPRTKRRRTPPPLPPPKK